MPTKVIIDTDPGVDDALALILALRSPELEVKAIVTVGGNVPVEQTTKNALRVLEILKPPDPPVVAKGEQPSWRKGRIRADSVHGRDGLGELHRFLDDQGRPLYPECEPPSDLYEAQEVYRELLSSYPDEILLITLGPLTNLARLLDSYGRKPRFQGVIAMGGAIGVPGNVTPVSEFNIYADPEAARAVFSSGLDITLVPLDVTTKVRVSAERFHELLAERIDPVTQFIFHATQRGFEYMERRTGQCTICLHDPLAVAVAIDPSLVETLSLQVDVETKGALTSGMTVADRRAIREEFKRPPNMKVALKVDSQRVLRIFEERVCRGS